MNCPRNIIRITLLFKITVLIASLCATALSATFKGSNTGTIVDGTRSNTNVPNHCGLPIRDVTLRFRDCAQNDTGEVTAATLMLSDPTAATGTISGRVRDSYGRGISRAQVSIIDLITGESRSTVSNLFGNFSLPDLMLGQTYILQIGHKRFVFEQEVQTLQLYEDMEIEIVGHRR